uniref:probable ATP-dependent RNA helicase DDX10 n=1 Tax=Ciona intestinalis TaxID=7719 RepID=UPI000180C1AE|nr:probable ATP-dependent RNA helicase DDX10 [Ciona intestinalis]|eukprot:XP_026692384.1 probable ATP-dependent RNA helicase DDX10 [Ciona intestinalis]
MSVQPSDIQNFKAWKGKKRKRKFVKKPKKEIEKEETVSLVDLDTTKVEKFEEFPFATKTKAGLRKAGFVSLTAIQRAAIKPAMLGKDILGAAKTGSGKTLAFIIPILECLHKHNWNSLDGPGALVISPTRELAFQIFEVLKKVGGKHNFSAGLLIGGNNVKEEAHSVGKTNIIICTPGRLLQHMDTTSYFHMNNLKMLILDEADRILDMGFKTTLDAIIENLPSERQTLLFSATQTKSVKDLARLSLRDPAYISVHSEAKHSTPQGLTQRFICCELKDKLNVLFSFIRNHQKSKCLVFVSSCKQVQFIFAAFCKLRPGTPMLHLHGRMNQLRRMSVYQEFCRKKFAVLVATDIAARGLDFPEIDWVVQLDCPEDADTYIHRAGRTARYNGNGNSLLVLTPTEKEAMLKHLQNKKVPILKSEIQSNKLGKIDRKLQSYCAEDKEFKEKAQRCFVAYIRSTFLMKDKSVFDAMKVPFSEFSSSLGLAIPPRVRFLERKMKSLKMKENSAVNDETKSSEFNFNEIDDECDLITVKRKNVFEEEEETSEVEEFAPDVALDPAKKKRSKAAEARRLLRKGMRMNQKIKFGDEGEVAEAFPPLPPSGEDGDGINIEEAAKAMQEADVKDREKHRLRIRERHRKKRLEAKKERRRLQAELEGGKQVVIGGDDDIGDDDIGDDVIGDDVMGDDVIDDDDVTNTVAYSDEEQEEEQEAKHRKLNTGFGSSLDEDEMLALHLLRNK